MSSPNSHVARLARVKGLSIRRSNAALPDAVGPRPDTSRRAVSGGEGTHGIEAEAVARGTGGPEPPPAPNDMPRNEGMVATAGSITLVKGRILIPERIKDHDHPYQYLGWYPLVSAAFSGAPDIDDEDDWPFLGDEKHKGREWPCMIVPGGHSELEKCPWFDCGECMFVTLFCITVPYAHVTPYAFFAHHILLRPTHTLVDANVQFATPRKREDSAICCTAGRE